MKIVKRAVSGLLAVVMGVTFTACKGAEKEVREPDKMDTIPMKLTNEEAKKSVNDVALRYFYLINSGNYDEAVGLLDLKKTDIMSASILDRLYKNVTNASFSTNYRVYEVSSELSSYDRLEGYEDYKVIIQYADITDSDFEPESSVAEGEDPVPDIIIPVIDPVTFSSEYSVEDYDSDEYFTELDMNEYDKEYAESQAELEEQEEFNNEDNAEDMDYKINTAIISEKALANGSNGDTDGANENTDVASVENSENGANDKDFAIKTSTNSVYNLKSMEIDVRKYVATDAMLKEEGMLESSVVKSVSSGSSSGNSKSSKAESSKSASGAEVTSESSESSELTGGKDEESYICKVLLPESFWNKSKVEFAVPKDAKLYLDDARVSTQSMNLDDWYVLERIPQLQNWTLRIETEVDAPVVRDIDLGYRVVYTYEWLQPSRSCKEGALSSAKSIMQSLYTSLEKNEEFNKSSFVKNKVGSKANKSEFKSYYDTMLFFNGKMTDSTVISVELQDINYSYFSMGIYDSRYITMPITVNYSYKAKTGEVTRRSVEGKISLTKENNTWKLWNIDEELVCII